MRGLKHYIDRLDDYRVDTKVKETHGTFFTLYTGIVKYLVQDEERRLAVRYTEYRSLEGGRHFKVKITSWHPHFWGLIHLPRESKEYEEDHRVAIAVEDHAGKVIQAIYNGRRAIREAVEKLEKRIDEELDQRIFHGNI